MFLNKVHQIDICWETLTVGLNKAALEKRELKTTLKSKLSIFTREIQCRDGI